MRSTQRGAPLPYRLLAAVLPCELGWLTATAKLQGVTMSPEEPQILKTFVDVLDYKPAYQVIAVFAPIGLLDQPDPQGRPCERSARQLLGWPRSGAIVSAPVRSALGTSLYEDAVTLNGGRLSPITWHQMSRIAEVDANIGPYWQRTVFEVHPELSFLQLNGDRPMRYSSHTSLGEGERRRLLMEMFPRVERLIDATVPGITPRQLLDVSACLWSARRIIARAVARLPENPEWDGMGLRMEYLR